MIVSTWNASSYNDSGAGYGVRISASDREKFFDKSWKSIILYIGKFENSVILPIRGTFWTICPELRNMKIGEYLIVNGLNKWKKGKPHKLILFPQNDNQFMLRVKSPKKLITWGGKSTFTYDGCVEIGTRIYFGKKSAIEVTKQHYQLLLKEFSGMPIKIGTSRDNAPINSLGYWLQNNITKTAIASYVGRILLQEGYAKQVDDSILKFN